MIFLYSDNGRLLTFLLFSILLVMFSAGCGTRGLLPEDRYNIAVSLANAANMKQMILDGGQFKMLAFGKYKSFDSLGGNAENKIASIYIEGDGLAWLSKYRLSPDPTPSDPIALRLAVRGNRENVFWLARPCQYMKLISDMPAVKCGKKYWSDARFAPEVVKAYNMALDQIKKDYGIDGFRLYGYSGGAGIAAIVTSMRADIISLYSVAGNIDHKIWTDYHGVSAMKKSLNPVDFAKEISTIPQLHLIGGDDEVIPFSLITSWRSKSENQNCINHMIIPGVSHENGWYERWDKLVKTPALCNN